MKCTTTLLKMFIVLCTLINCTLSIKPTSSSSSTSGNAILKNPVLLQVSARPWLLSLSKTLGINITTFTDIPNSVYTSLQSMNIDYLWVMGVWKIGEYGLNHDRTKESLIEEYKHYLPDYTTEDAIGCPYAITEYTCNPQLCPNGDNDLLEFKSKLNSYNIKLMLDFVPNHSAYDSPWMSINKDYYIRERPDVEHNSTFFFENGVAFGGKMWTDVAQLNYFNPETRQLMQEQMLKIASLSDGMRCDVAFMVSNSFFELSWKNELQYYNYTTPSTDFWEVSIAEVKRQYPNTIFLAEVYGSYVVDMITQGFDYVYDRDLLTHLTNGNVDEVRAYLYSTAEYEQYMARFLENHDENRAASFFKNRTTITNAAALIAYTVPGMRFLFQDFQFGYKFKLEVHLRRSYDEPKDQEAVEFYEKYLSIFTSDVFKYGEFEMVEVKGDDAYMFVAWKWKYGKEKRVVIVNFDNNQRECFVVVKDAGEGKEEVAMEEMLSGVKITRKSKEVQEEGLFVIVKGYSGMIFTYN